MSTNNKWQALSMKDRAFLIREAVRNGITDINSIRDLYNQNGERIRLGTPYKTFESGSEYDYFNAAPENMPQENDGHWSSRNPHTGQLLKSPNHPTYNLLLEGEKQAGYKVQKIGDREYSFPNEHRFDGTKNNKIQTDTEHKTDNSLIERIALNIGSKDSAKDEGYAGISDIVTGTIDALLGKTPTSNNNLAAFLGKPENYGFEEISDTRGPQFPEVISRYADQNFKTYKGIINPYNEYVVAKEDYDKFMKMAQDGTIFYNNADWDNVNYIHQIIEGNKSTWAPVYFDHKYRDDVQNYPIQFYTKNGKLYANAADLYDFNTESWQGKMLTKKGIPYILRQNDIPVRAIDVPEELLNLHPMYYNNELTDEYKRARNIHRTIKAREEEEKIKK